MGIRILDKINEDGTIEYEIILDRDYYHVQHDIIDWCREQYGFKQNTWEWSEIFGHTFITFYTEKDRNWFLLKWSNNRIY